MEFEWDASKARRNVAKHGVSFEIARRVWDDPLHVILPDRFEDGEERWHAIGVVGGVALLVVVIATPTRTKASACGSSARERRRLMREGAMSKKEFSPKELCELEKLAALSDDKIDTQDIPEAPAENWAFARRGAFYKPVKQPVSIRIDADVLDWFKRHAEGRGYQTEINQVLRRHVMAKERQR